MFDRSPFTLQTRDRFALLAMLTVLFLYFLFSVHQMASLRQRELYERTRIEDTIRLEEEKHILLAYIAKSSLPEVVLVSAKEQGYEYRKFPIDEATYVHLREERR